MLRKENDKIYLKEVRTSLYENIFLVISFGLLCVNHYFREINKGNGIFTGKSLIIFLVACFLIYALKTMFSSTNIIFIDTLEKVIVFEQGNKKHKQQVKVKYEEIKKIVIVNYCKKYTIDIYDNELNAYECFDDKEYENILIVADEIENILKIKIEDKTDKENYEGFRQRKI
jgi:hypothetical protein